MTEDNNYPKRLASYCKRDTQLDIWYTGPRWTYPYRLDLWGQGTLKDNMLYKGETAAWHKFLRSVRAIRLGHEEPTFSYVRKRMQNAILPLLEGDADDT